MARQKMYKGKAHLISCNVDERLFHEIKMISLDTGATKTEIVRRAIAKFVDIGQEDSFVMANIVRGIDALESIKDDIPEDKYKELKGYYKNIMDAKGGNRNGNF